MEKKLITPLILSFATAVIIGAAVQSCKTIRVQAAPTSIAYVPVYITQTITKVVKQDTLRRSSDIYDPSRINRALDKIDNLNRVAANWETRMILEKGYFRVVDSLRSVRSREKLKDSTILVKDSTIFVLRTFINTQDGQNKKQNDFNQKILKNQEEAKLNKATFGMFEWIMTICMVFVAIVGALHFGIYLNRK